MPRRSRFWSRVDTLVIDKTGTLTEGKPQLVSVRAGVEDEAELLRLAASLERASEHPLAAAIVGGRQERGLRLFASRRVSSRSPGQGVRGMVDGRSVAARQQFSKPPASAWTTSTSARRNCRAPARRSCL